MKLMIDTNIILDVLFQRESFYEASAEILRLCNTRTHTGYMTTNSVCDIFYITRKALQDKEQLYRVIENLCGILSLCDVTSQDVTSALTKRATDFEDCLLAECAKHSDCQYIITRNVKDFKDFDVKAITPEKFLSLTH